MLLPRLQQLLRALPWHQQQHLPAAATSAAVRHLAAAATPAPAAAAAQHQAAEDPGINNEQQHAGDASWRPRRSLPPAGLYSVKVVIKAHDLRFVKAASTVIRDLMLVNFAPKSREVLPPQLRQRSRLPWVQLALPGGDVSLPTRRTHFTVIRGPHVHKSSREQFARTTHKRVVCHATNNLSEMTWFLDSLKLYQFVGVELAIKVSSCSYLLPTTAAEQAAAAQPLLEQHKRRFAHLFGAIASSSSSGSGSGLEQQQDAGDASYAALQQSLQGLTQTVQDGLLQQRLRLASSPAFQRWRQRLSRGVGSGDAAAAAAAAAAGPAPAQQVLEDAAGQQLQGSGLLAAGEPQQQQQQQAAATSDEAFRAAVEKALLGLKLDVLDRHKFYPFLMAFYKPGSAVPAAEWMQAMLKYGLHMQQQVEVAQAAAGTQQGLQQLGQVTQAAALLLLQQWHAAADGGTRRQLGMPDVDAAGAMADSSVPGRSKDG